MRFISELSFQETKELEALHRDGKSHRERMRAQAILLSSKGFEIETLAVIFSAARDTVRDWLDRFEQEGVAGLQDAAKPGRPPKLDNSARALIVESLQTPTPNLKPLLQERLKKGALS